MQRQRPAFILQEDFHYFIVIIGDFLQQNIFGFQAPCLVFLGNLRLE